MGWDLSSNYKSLTKEFTNPISYELTIMDWAQNTSQVPINIQNATYLSLQYGGYDDTSKLTLTSHGGISSPNTISSNLLCKTEAIFTKLSGKLDASTLQGRCYLYTHWGDLAYGICKYSELFYYHGYHPSSNTSWITSQSGNQTMYFKEWFTQFGGTGINVANATCLNANKPIPSTIAKQYPYGISGIQFRLKNCPDLSIVYQAYIKDIGWIPCSYDGQENVYRHDKPFSSFRMNIVPKSELERFIAFWNKHP